MTSNGKKTQRLTHTLSRTNTHIHAHTHTHTHTNTHTHIHAHTHKHTNTHTNTHTHTHAYTHTQFEQCEQVSVEYRFQGLSILGREVSSANEGASGVANDRHPQFKMF